MTNQIPTLILAKDFKTGMATATDMGLGEVQNWDDCAEELLFNGAHEVPEHDFSRTKLLTHKLKALQNNLPHAIVTQWKGGSGALCERGPLGAGQHDLPVIALYVWPRIVEVGYGVVKEPTAVSNYSYQWNPLDESGKPKPASEVADEHVGSTTYDEVNELLGTSGCSTQEPFWDWSVMGAVEVPRGKLVVCPGDRVVVLEGVSCTVVPPAQWEAFCNQMSTLCKEN